MSYIGKTPTPVPLTSSDITDSIISLPKLTDGTDGNLISYDASGNPVAVATGTDGQVLTSTGAGSPPVFETLPAGGTNTPAFEATLTSTTNPGDATFFKGNYNTEVYDTNGNYDAATNKRFTPTVAGKYFIYLSANFDAQAVNNFGSCKIAVYKNGSSYRESYFDEFNNYYAYAKTPYLGTVVDMNGSTDYVEGYLFFNIITGTAYRVTYGVFGGYKIIE
jgi:hypothetical protein